ncbi:AraC family transcriptional regulator [Paenibacillus pectinilyticus]|uniref:AraC family transcriptional regulator n=1 Tax=Paenibacillus pectinilyticus TaxID=512399 RepID=A0A1C0ZTV9_9BACL|nr:AraC family transcriptional regulator [Paenibacillus pectinilyticus]OCT11525.1 AraC family transcriptional regulator [Paenibacillus pectinilyticus]
MSEVLTKDEDTFLCLDHTWLKFRTAQLVQEGKLAQQFVSSYCILVVKHGEGLLTIDLQTYHVQSDTVHVVVPGQTVGFCEESGEKPELYMISFDVLGEAQHEGDFPLRGELSVHFESTLVQLCEQLCLSSRSESAMERFRGQSVFHELVYWLMTHIRLQPKSDSRAAMDRTKSYIETHFHESMTIEQLARMAEISSKYYVSLFKKTYGKTAIDYLTEVRVNMAKQLMLQADVRLKDVAFQVGYNDEFYFSRMFKKEVGVSPTVYLKNRRQRIVAYSANVLGQLLALKIMPYAAPLHPKWTSYYYNKYRTDIPMHLSGYRFNEDWETNVEALEDSQVDCIISTDQLAAQEKERLSNIAPVHIVPLYEQSWQEQLHAIAQIVGALDEAVVWISGYNRKVKLLRERLQEELRNDSVVIVSLFNNRFFLFPTQGMRDAFTDLGLQSPHSMKGYADNQSLTIEELAELDMDHLLLNIRQESETLQHWERIRTSRSWQDLKVVRRNRVHHISSDPWREYSAYAMERMVADIEDHLCDNRT